jgi:hypothetical protein
VSLRARVPPSRASHRAAGGRFTPATVRLPAAAGNLTQMDIPLDTMEDRPSVCRRVWHSPRSLRGKSSR